MKRLLSLVLIAIFVLSLCGCADKVADVKVLPYTSELFTDSEVEAAIEITKTYFIQEFNGCTLTEITYIGDEKNGDYEEFAQRHNADEVIVLISSFDVGPNGGDGSLNTNDTYSNWMWILVREKGGQWRHVDHGY